MTLLYDGLVAFDIETDGLFDESYSSESTPAVLCVSTIVMDRLGVGEYSIVERKDWVNANGIKTCAVLNTEELVGLVNYMWEWCNSGEEPWSRRVLGWNTTGFDFRVLASTITNAPESEGFSAHKKNDCVARIQELAWHSIDPMFTFFMHKGFPVAMNSVAKAMTPSVVKSGSGGSVSELWFQGDETSRNGVVAYCRQDTDVLATIISAIESEGAVKWVTKSTNKLAVWQPLSPWDVTMCVCAANNLTEPDNSWMNTNPPKRAGFIGWLEQDNKV